MNNKVSILMPCYNSDDYLDISIRSVVEQSYGGWELIIVDDGSDSTDVREKMVYWQSKDPRIKTIYLQANQGVAHARNAGLKIASGRYIAFLDSDDMWMAEKLEKQLLFMKQTDSALTYTAYSKINNYGQVISQKIDVPATATYEQMLNNSCIACLTVVYDREKIGDIQMPDVFHEDYAMWLKLLRQGIVARGLNDVLASYRIHSRSISHNKLKCALQRWVVYRECEGLSLPASMKHLMAYVYTGIRKTLS